MGEEVRKTMKRKAESEEVNVEGKEKETTDKAVVPDTATKDSESKEKENVEKTEDIEKAGAPKSSVAEDLDPETAKKNQWVKHMRRLFTPADMITEDGELNMEY